MKLIKKLESRKLKVTAGIVCASAALAFTACDRNADTTTRDARGAAVDTADRMHDASNDAAERVREAARDAARTNRSVDADAQSRDIKRAANNAADQVRDSANDTAKAIKEGAKDAADQVGKGVQKTGEEIQRQSR